MGLRTKLLLPAVLGFLFFALVVHYDLIPRYLEHERSVFIENENHVLEIMTPTLIRLILQSDLATLHASLDNQLEQHKDHWQQLMLYDEDSKLLYPIEESVPPENEFLTTIKHELSLYDEVYGHIKLTLNWEHEYQDKLTTIHQVEELLLTIFGLIIILSSLWQGYLINRPLLHLKNAAAKLANGDYKASLPKITSDELGQLTQAFDTMRDQLNESLTDLHQAVAMAQFHEEKQRAVINTMSDAAITIDVHGLIESFNPAAERIFGYDASEVLDKNIGILIPEYNAGTHNDLLQFDFENETTNIIGKTNELKARHKNGRIIDIEITVSEIITEEMHMYSSIIRDITERKKTEEELRIAAISFDTHEGIVITDSNANILKVNKAFTEITGYSEKEVIGKTPKILKSDRQNQIFYQAMWDELLNQGRWSGEIWNKRKDGEVYPEWLAITAVKNEQGVTTHYAANFLDVSENKNQQLKLEQKTIELEQAKNEAEDASKAKSDFLATMSHEIRTPMNGVLGMTQLLSATKLEKEQREHLNSIEHSGQMLLSIINDILDFSKIEAGKMELEPITFNLEQTAFNALQMFNTTEKNIELLFNYAQNCPRFLVGDAGRIRQILVNLINNAIKFTSKGHVLVDISSEKKTENQAQLLLRIEDTGIGITDEVQQTLFKEFAQADTSTTRKYGGTGLGLAICKKLVKLMNGEIGITSTPGEGAIFWVRITLPFIEQPAPIPKIRLNNIRALVVDDNVLNRRLLNEQLTGYGMLVDTANSAQEALNKLTEAHNTDKPFQLAIVDLMMPEMDGEMLGSVIKSDPKLQDLPLILLTSAGQRGDAQQFKENGFAAYLTKPVSSEVLRQSLEAVAGLKQQNQQHELITQYSFTDNNYEMNKNPEFKAKILLAEDDITNQKVAIGTLKQFGLIPDLAENGNQAVKMFSENTYDLVFMDCHMPEMDGYEATRQIRSIEQDQYTPIVAMTANIQPSDQKKCKQAGMDDFLGKPFLTQDLVAILFKWLNTEITTTKTETPTTADPIEQTQVVNQSTLDSLHNSVGDELHSIISCFVTETDKKLDLLNEHIANKNFTELERLNHSLKSSSASLGATQLSAYAATLEEIAHHKTLENFNETLEKMVNEFLQVKNYFQKMK